MEQTSPTRRAALAVLTRLVALGATVALVAAACGRDPEEFAGTELAADAGAAEATGTIDPTTTPTTAGGPADSETDAGDRDGAQITRPGLDEGAFGDLGVVCGPGEGTPRPLGGETGLSGDTIRVGTLADPGYTGQPGLNQEMFDTASAVVAWCNSVGGVRGYQLELDLLDSALTEHQARIVEACDADWFLVGGGSVFDGDGQVARLDCALPDISAFVVTPDAAESDLSVSGVPNPVYTISSGAHRWIASHFPDAIGAVGILTGSVPATGITSARHREVAERVGWEFTSVQEYNPLGESNWKPFVQRLIDEGATGLIYTGEPQNLVAIQQAMRDLDYAPEFILTDANHYDDNYIAVGGDAIVNTFVSGNFHPFEEAADNPATQQYLDLLERNGGGKVALLGVQGLSSWMLFLTAVGECVDAGTITRDCVFSAAQDKDGWTGGGLHGPQHPGTRVTSDCFLMLEATPEGFVRVDVDANRGIFRCDPENVTPLEGDYGDGARCPSGVVDPRPSEC